MNKEQIAERLRANDIPAAEGLPGMLETYLHLLTEWNRKMDLTAVEGAEDLLDKHFIDSLTVLKTGLLPEHGRLIDVGTGAGFPGLVLAIARKDLDVTLLDAQQKRLNFLQAVADELGLQNVKLIHSRAEDGGRRPELREQFDIAAARAVAPLNVLCEYLLPYVRIGGRMLCWKGPGLQEEYDAGRKACFLLGGRPEEAVSCPVAGKDWEHLILPVVKTGKTPGKYPRRAGLPKQLPLGV